MSLGPHHPHHHPLNRGGHPDTRGHPNSTPGHHDRASELSSIKEGGTVPSGETLAASTTDYESDEENAALLLQSKPVDNYSGKYLKEEILALHRTDYPAPQGFVFEEDITSKIQLLPVALSRYTRNRILDSSAGLKGSFATQEGSSNFFLGRPVKAGRGRGRRFNEDHVGLNFSAPLDPRTQFLQSESLGLSHHMSNPNININNINQSGTIPNPHLTASSLHSSAQQLNISGITTSNPTSLAGSTQQYTPAGGSSYGFNSFLGEDFILDDEKWYYKDPKGQERGPFGSMQMDKWVKFDFFKVDLMVRRENSEYVYLGDIFFSEGKNPFTGEPLDQWFMGPTSEFKISLMLLIQNYHMNRMKQEQPNASQVEYEFNLNKNPAEQQQNNPVPTAHVNEPPYNKAPSSQALNKSTTMTLPLKSEIEEGSNALPEKRIADTKPSSDAPWNEYPVQDKTMWWANTSEPSIQLGSSGAWQKPAAVPAPVPPASKDWTTLQKEQTQQLQQIVAQMNKPKKNKKKKGKNQKPNQGQPAGKPAINVTQPIQKKPQNESQDQPPKSSNPPASQKPNTNVPQNNNSAQKPQPADNKTKPQSPPQTRQSINKKPKPQYKVKESTPSEPDLIKPNDQDSNNANAAATSPTQFSKRQNIRQPKVWKRKDEDLNDDENN